MSISVFNLFIESPSILKLTYAFLWMGKIKNGYIILELDHLVKLTNLQFHPTFVKLVGIINILYNII